jgi:innexin
LGNPNKSHQYTVQCALPINLFNQQIFTAIWIWYIVVLFWNVAEAITWVNRCHSPVANEWILDRVKMVKHNAANANVDAGRIEHFLGTYLERDGKQFE